MFLILTGAWTWSLRPFLRSTNIVHMGISQQMKAIPRVSHVIRATRTALQESQDRTKGLQSMAPITKPRSLVRGRMGPCPTSVLGVWSHSPRLPPSKAWLSFQANKQGDIPRYRSITDKSYTLNNGVTIPAIGKCLVILIIKYAPDGTCR